MSKIKTSPKSGFTLIELSIVLIIIGLLVAGVTGGASLIKSAQLRSLTSEARGYGTAVNSFIAQYDELPGDYANSINSSGSGNGNGQINFSETKDVSGTPTLMLEGIIAWAQLKNAGVIDSTFTLPSPTSTPPSSTSFTASGSYPALSGGNQIPAAKIDGGGWLFDYTTSNTNARNVLIVTGAVATAAFTLPLTAGHVVPTGVLTPSDALSVDTKIDDGKPNQGRVRGATGLVTTTNCYTATGNAGIYDTSKTTKSCALEFTVDIS